ncbi:MAG: hypothetical protein ACKVQA_02075 [Burkholderiales bacterium]
MVLAVNEIPWQDPIVPIFADPEWEREVKQKTGSVMDIMRRAAPSPWLRQMLLALGNPAMVHITGNLAAMMSMVTAQENACRYCYGATRATMRILGYSEKRIGAIERGVQLADFNERERTMLLFTRNLARSNPRPSRQDREQLAAVGFPSQAIAEAALFVAIGCFMNRVATFMAVPPVLGFERFANSLLGRILGPLMAGKVRIKPSAATGYTPSSSRFTAIAQGLAGLPAATVFHDAIEGAFASPVLSVRLKSLMFAVVARALQCPYCEKECRHLLAGQGMSPGEIDSNLSTLSDPRLPAAEQHILAWTRNTVRYETEQIQKSTRALGEKIGAGQLIEAIGVASLANAAVRLAVILE